VLEPPPLETPPLEPPLEPPLPPPTLIGPPLLELLPPLG
jgi:hypothetical protein